MNKLQFYGPNLKVPEIEIGAVRGIMINVNESLSSISNTCVNLLIGLL